MDSEPSRQAGGAGGILKLDPNRREPAGGPADWLKLTLGGALGAQTSSLLFVFRETRMTEALSLCLKLMESNLTCLRLLAQLMTSAEARSENNLPSRTCSLCLHEASS